jgi:hypothetical protein
MCIPFAMFRMGDYKGGDVWRVIWIKHEGGRRNNTTAKDGEIKHRWEDAMHHSF